MSEIDKELANAPTPKAFVFAILAKYGILGIVVVYLGWLNYLKDEQLQHNFQMLLHQQEKLSETITRSQELDRVTLHVLQSKFNIERKDDGVLR